ncbi:MAG: hypothetical protein ACP5TE_01075 [Verrucomicrobiia bacterium]|jgi:hypothetical protein
MRVRFFTEYKRQDRVQIMADEYDSSDFIDKEYFESKTPGKSGGGGAPSAPSVGATNPPPSQAELDSRATEVQQEIEKLRRLQEDLARKKAALEETRRRRLEWETSRKELVHGLTRAVGLLQEAEFSRRQEAEQMAKAIAGLRDALMKVQSIDEESWTKENFEIELTRALTVVENARQEWNSARLKFPFLDGKQDEQSEFVAQKPEFKIPDFYELIKIGFAVSLPLILIILVLIIVILVKR